MTTLWESTLRKLRDRLSEETFSAWLEPIVFDGIDGRTVHLRIPNRFFADWIGARYLPDILDSLGADAGLGTLTVAFTVDPSLQERAADAAPVALAAAPAERRAVASQRPSSRPAARSQASMRARIPELPFDAPTLPERTEPPRRDLTPTRVPIALPEERDGDYALNPRYTFDNFVVGPSNQLAHAAALAASSSPGKRYNPLFIYSKVGLGKTHLVNAVGHRVLDDRPDARVLFLSAERFTNEFIWALQNKRIDEFRNRYRVNCDVLVIDDIQFLAGREQTQEEFFHTFNALYHADRQIVVTSDVYPQQIGEMQERLVSRFQWGLVADIQAPELDTRIAILRKKAEQEGIALRDDVALLVAQVVQSNVRELEGTLLRIAVRADLERRPIDLDLVRDALGTMIASQNADKVCTVEDVQRAACEYFGLQLKELKSERRHRAVSMPRMIAMYVCRERLRLSYPELGDRFGGKDHTTVMNAHRKITAMLGDDEQVRRAVDAIERKLGLG